MNLATIQRINEIVPIEGADNIELVKVLGWQVVVKKGEYQVNDLCCYIQIDTVVPEKEYFEFLRERKFRVRTIKLRKQISQGLIVPLSILPNSDRPMKWGYTEGTDVTDIIGITKYEKPDNNPIRESKPKRPTAFWKRLKYDFKYHFLYRWFPKLRPKTRSVFPKHLVPITDEERIQNIPKVLEQYRGKDFIASYKLDGSSITIIHEKNFLGKSVYRICSRRFELHDKNNDWYEVFTNANFKEYVDLLVTIFNTNDIIVQGEAIGSFNGNHHNLNTNEIRLFNIYVNGKRINQKEFIDICETHQIPHCPKYWEGKLEFTLPEILEFAQIKDIINPTVEAEGLVFRCVEDGLSFKCINNNYLLNEK